MSDIKTYSWIAKRRRALGLSQDGLADRLRNYGFDFTRATISHWEKGRYRPPYKDPEFIRALADSLEMDTKNILFHIGLVGTDDNDDASRVVEIFESLTPERQKTALVILEQLLKEG